MVKVDAAIIGAGVFGLAAAERLSAAGMRVAVIERARIGAGSSGGVLGALTAHTPDPWNPKKEFQAAALLSLPGYIAALEDETGVDCGYARIGRATPLTTPRARALAEERQEAAAARWGGFSLGVEETPPPGAAPAAYGWLRDGLAARLWPRGYLAALAAAARGRGAILLQGVAFEGFEDGRVVFTGGEIQAPVLVLANGWRSFAAAARLSDEASIGGAEKGQTTLLRPRAPYEGPLVYADGIYVVPHANGLVAVGGAAAKTWDDESAADLPRDYLAAAEALCPWLSGAEAIEHWAGARPRCDRRDPVLGEIAKGVWLTSGGFKIGFGIAHRMAQALADRLTGAAEPVALPPSFTLDHHRKAAP